ncbi:YdgA family protein [Citrobacter sp. Cu233]|uniref:YdgA family protein n=1 Tax=Citrobacter sp. Cu233 TaxID=2985160 RepID=UPI0025773300|nr:YdgA family protein [Citrobacter sp. Cu233]MDM2935153.1 YdgA family protein [Citrobacter sp. Cu233]
MKKSLVAAGVVVALGIVWTGGAWYTGKKLETHLAEMVTQANDQIKRYSPEAGIELSYQNYQRGVFSSQLQLVVKPIAGQENAWLKAGQTIVLDETVDHGPFPLTQLKSLNLIPAMASVRTILVNNDVTKPLFDIAKGESPFVINSRISYSGDTRSDLSLKPLNYEKGDEKVTFSGGEFQFTADKDGNAVSLTGAAQNGQVNAVNEYDQKVQITFNNLTTEGSSSVASFGERIGDQKLSLDKLSISVEGNELAVLEGMGIDGKSDLINDGKTVNSQLDYTLNSLKLQGQDLGSGKLTLKVGQIDGEALHQFSQQYSAQTKALMSQIDVVQNPELYQQKVTEAFFNALPILMKGEPVITLAPLSWKNAKGETTFNLSLLLKDPTATKEEPQTLAQEVDRSVKSLDAKLAIPVDMATEFMTQIAKIEGYQQEQAAGLAKQQVNGLAAMGQMFRITTMQDNTIGSSLQYTNGQVTLNGQKMPLDEFVGMFGMPTLGEPDAPAVPQQ